MWLRDEQHYPDIRSARRVQRGNLCPTALCARCSGLHCNVSEEQNPDFAGRLQMICTPPSMACRSDADGCCFIASRPSGRAINKASSRSRLAVYPHSSVLHTAETEKSEGQCLSHYIAPIPLASFAGEPTQNIGKSFIKSYGAVCLEGAIIVLACIIFSVFASSPPAVDTTAAAASMVWSYIGDLIFNMLILVGAVKMADRLVHEMMGL